MFARELRRRPARARLSPVRALALILILVTFALAVYPDPAVHVLGLSPAGGELAIRLFAGVNAILLTLASGLFGRNLRIRDSGTLSPGFAELDHISFEAKSPSSVCLVLNHFPSYADGPNHVADFLRSASILANMRPILVRNFREFVEWLAKPSVVCAVADARHYEVVIQECRRYGKPAFFMRDGASFDVSRSAGRVDIDVGVDFAIERISDLASELVTAFSLDTPRRIGFRGNWMTTYGLMALDQDRHGKVRGVYWYGGGELTGQCVIDLVHEVAILEYEWSQKANELEIGSRNEGYGTFYSPAGYPVFMGYWHNRAEPDTIQSWCGCRLTHDVAANIQRGGAYSVDFGLSQHPVSNIVAR